MKYVTTIKKAKSFEIDWARMPANAQEKIIAYGVQRIFNDMVGGDERFPTNEDKFAHVEKMIERFYAGDIGRVASAGVSTEQAIARTIVRKALKDQLGAKSEKWAAFTGLNDATQAKKLDELFERYRDRFAPAVAEEVKLRAQRAKASEKLAGGMEVDL